MTGALDVNLDTETAFVDGAWTSRDELWTRLNESVASKDYKNIARLAALLEEFDKALEGARTIDFRIGKEASERLEELARGANQTAEAFARSVLLRALEKPAEPSSVPQERPVVTSQETPVQASVPSVPHPGVTAPPVMTPVVPVAPAADETSIDVDVEDDSKAPDDGRRWYDRT